MKNCPYCAETIKDEAIVCRFCGHVLDPASFDRIRSAGAPNRTLAETSEEKVKGEANPKSILLSSAQFSFGLTFIVLLPLLLFAIIIGFDLLGQEGLASLPFLIGFGAPILGVRFLLTWIQWLIIVALVLALWRLVRSKPWLGAGVLMGICLLGTLAASLLIIGDPSIFAASSGNRAETLCSCPFLNASKYQSILNGENVCITGIAENINSDALFWGDSFRIRGYSVANSFTVFGPYPSALQDGDMVGVYGPADTETNRISAGRNDIAVCSK